MLSLAYFLIVLSLAIISTQGSPSVHNPFYCYSTDPIRPRSRLGGSHSNYEINRGQIEPNVSTCNPSKFWMLGRHGTRLPLAAELSIGILGDITRLRGEILSYYDQGRTSLCASDVELIRNWQLDQNITMEVAGYLSSAGWNELEGLAQRYQAAFPSILPSTYSPNDYFFRSTDLQRTRVSLHAFADGLFGVNGHEQVQFEDTPEPDIFMRPYLNCPLYSQINAVRTEQIAFREGPEYQEMISQVSAKLGFHWSHVLRDNDINLLARQCRFDQIWGLNQTSVLSPFCTAFSVANTQVIEYFEDVDFYHRVAYGKPEYRRLYENLNCFLMQDMLHFIRSNNVNDHTARIFNAHINQVLILVNFGAFEGDVPLTRHNFAQQMERMWKSGVHMPMASNLAVIRYDCEDGDNDILFLYNEKPLQIPGCQTNGVCKQSLILERFRHFLDVDCMEVFCTNS